MLYFLFHVAILIGYGDIDTEVILRSTHGQIKNRKW